MIMMQTEEDGCGNTTQPSVLSLLFAASDSLIRRGDFVGVCLCVVNNDNGKLFVCP